MALYNYVRLSRPATGSEVVIELPSPVTEENAQEKVVPFVQENFQGWVPTKILLEAGGS